jgi:hypothetical protein
VKAKILHQVDSVRGQQVIGVSWGTELFFRVLKGVEVLAATVRSCTVDTYAQYHRDGRKQTEIDAGAQSNH